MLNISVVVPVNNEEENVLELYRRLSASLPENSNHKVTFIFVNDGSYDKTLELF